MECGDPSCAPIDTLVRIIFQNKCGCVFGIPAEAASILEEDLADFMPPEDFFHEWKAGNNKPWPPAMEVEIPEPGDPPDVELRFPVGTRVECCVARGPNGWRPGTVVGHWYRAKMWPTGQYAPYQVKLDAFDNMIFAPQDTDNCIRAEPKPTAE